MKKIFSAFILTLTVLVLTACNGGKSDSQDNSEIDNAPKYSIQLELNCVRNLLFSKYDLDVFVDGNKIGKLDHGATRTYSVELVEGTHTLVAAKEGSRTIDGTIDLEISEDSKFMYKLSCTSQQVEIEEISEPEATTEESTTETGGKKDAAPTVDNSSNQTVAETDASYSQTEGRDYRESLDSDGLIKIPEEGESDTPPTDSSNNHSGDSAENSQTELLDNNRSEESLYYSTNDRETAKKGNTGVFAYSSIGGTYSNYWVIDFDEEYVYRFAEGNGDGTCDRLKIDSGDLNTVLIITYHDGNNEWSYGLHFKRKNLPDALILQEESGFEYTYYPVDLNSALEIRDSKTITDY